MSGDRDRSPSRVDPASGEVEAKEDPSWRPAFLSACLILTLGILCAVIWWRGQDSTEEPLPVLGSIPAFRFLDQSGAAFELADLLGKVWVGDFVFTRCGSACPRMARTMSALQSELAGRGIGAGDVRFVSFSVDPAYDTPDVLAAFGARYGADPASWSFLTGADGEVVDLSQNGFFLAASQGRSGGAAHSHSDRFALVDRRGRLRGHYQPTASESEYQRLRDDILRLLAEPPSDVAGEVE